MNLFFAWNNFHINCDFCTKKKKRKEKKRKSRELSIIQNLGISDNSGISGNFLAECRNCRIATLLAFPAILADIVEFQDWQITGIVEFQNRQIRAKLPEMPKIPEMMISGISRRSEIELSEMILSSISSISGRSDEIRQICRKAARIGGNAENSNILDMYEKNWFFSGKVFIF